MRAAREQLRMRRRRRLGRQRMRDADHVSRPHDAVVGLPRRKAEGVRGEGVARALHAGDAVRGDGLRLQGDRLRHVRRRHSEDCPLLRAERREADVLVRPRRVRGGSESRPAHTRRAERLMMVRRRDYRWGGQFPYLFQDNGWCQSGNKRKLLLFSIGVLVMR